MTIPPPAATTRRIPIRISLEAFNRSAGLRVFYDALCGSGTFVFVGFALSLKVPKEQMGIIASVVSFACIWQIAGLALVNLIGDKKRFILRLGLVEPLLFLAMLLALPLAPPAWRLWVMVGAVFLAAGMVNLTRPLSEEWFASTVPESLRARFLGRRLQIVLALTMVCTLSAGYLVHRIDQSNTLLLGIILGVGCLFGVLAVAALRAAAMPGITTAARVHWRDVREVFHQAPFRNYLIGTLIYNIPFMPANAYYQVFNLRILHMDTTLIAAMSVGYLVVRILATSTATNLLDRYGARRMVLACGPLYAAFFCAFIFCTPERVWPLLVAWAGVALADAVFGIALPAALYAVVPETPARPAYFAINSLVLQGAFGLCALLSVRILQALDGVTLTLGPLTLHQFHLFYLLCAGLMVPATFGAWLLPGLKRKRAGRSQ